VETLSGPGRHSQAHRLSQERGRRDGCAPDDGRGRCGGGTHRYTAATQRVAGSTAVARSAVPRASPHQRRDGCAPGDGRFCHGGCTHKDTAATKRVAGNDFGATPSPSPHGRTTAV